MGILVDTCHDLKQALADIEIQCQIILDNVQQFDKRVSSYAFERLTRRLCILGNWIIVWEEHLYKEHGEQGHVCVFLSEAKGMTILWVKNEEIVADKAWYEAGGSKVLTVEEAIGIIKDNLAQVNHGNWATVVEWVKRYGKSPGLDFSKISGV